MEARLVKKSFLFGHLFLNITNVFCAKKRAGHACICPRMVAGEPILKLSPPPKKLVFPRPKNNNGNSPLKTGCARPLLKKSQAPFFLLLFWLFLSEILSRRCQLSRTTSDPACRVPNHRLIRPSPQLRLPKLKLVISAETLPWHFTSLRLPWASQWESAVALESDDPRCCIFSHSAKNYLASRSCPAPSRLYYLL